MDATCIDLTGMDEDMQLALALVMSSEESKPSSKPDKQGGGGAGARTCSVFGCENTDFVHPACSHPICNACLMQLKRSHAADAVPCPACRKTMVFPRAEPARAVPAPVANGSSSHGRTGATGQRSSRAARAGTTRSTTHITRKSIKTHHGVVMVYVRSHFRAAPKRK